MIEQTLNLMKQYQNYMETVFQVPKTQWFTENTITYESNAIIVRRFRKGSNIIFIVPPQASHDSSIVDYDNKQSLVQTALESGDFAVYCIEWKSCTHDRRNESIDDLVSQLFVAVENARIDSNSYEGIHLVGLCMGGWLSSIFNCVYSEFVKTLIVAGSPINVEVDRDLSSVCGYVDSLPQSFYENLVMLGGGRMLGEYMLFGWKAANWSDRYIKDYIDIWNASEVGNEETLRKIKRFRNWYENTCDIAGNWYLTIVDRLFRKNDLYNGKMVVKNKSIVFDEIQNQIISIAGSNDNISPVGQAFGHKHGEKILIDGVGHIGLFMGSKAQGVWKNIFKNLLTSKE